MKAERRHELQENELMKQATRAVKVMQLPDLRRKWLGRAAVVVAVIAVVALFIRSRISATENAYREAAEHLSIAAPMVEAVRNAAPNPSEPMDAKYINFVQSRSEQANSELDKVSSTSNDAKLLAQAAVLRGDVNFTMANIPVWPTPTTASTQPIPALKQSRDEYLAQATSAYQEVVDKFSDQSLNLICAQFGLAAVAENRSDWPGATNHYQAVLTNENSSPTQKLYAQQRINILPELNHPALLVNAETAPLVSATQPAVPSTTPSILKPATLPK